MPKGKFVSPVPRRSNPSAEVDVGDTLETLISQFTDPFAFLRELVQNSLDANTTRVDIELEYDEPKGILTLHVIDTGEGMNREIIDTQLTRLFSSSKEGDLTKIGKFGIGFVSIFAIEPEYVAVDTGRDGEYWRVLFLPDRTFERIVLETPVEGTHIRLFKRLRPEELEAFRQRCRDTLVYWCKHAEADIFFEGQRINRPLDLEAPCCLRHEVPGTEIVAAPSSDPEPFFGFYNRGLTLHEGWESLIPGIQFKIKSRYLEHTLTRDNVLKDENYYKAMALLQKVVDGPLRRMLLENLARSQDDRLAAMVIFRLPGLPREMAAIPVLPAVEGPLLSIADVRRLVARHRQLLWEPGANPVTAALGASGIRVLQVAAHEEGKLALLRTLARPWPVQQATLVWSVLLPTEPPPGGQELLAATARLLRRAGSSYRRLYAGRFLPPLEDRLFLPARPGELLKVDSTRPRRGWRLFGGGQEELTVNLFHPLVEPHFRLFARHPALAAYLLAKCLTLDDGLDPATEARLAAAALDEEATLARA